MMPKDPVKQEETRRKMSVAAKKRMADPEIRNKIKEANVGKKQSLETIAKRVEKLKGQKRPLRTEESRSKYSQAQKKLWEDPEYRQRMSEVHTGKKQSPETIAKRAAANTGQQRSPRTKKNCAFCGKEMVLLEGEKNRRFCSMACKGKWQSENAIDEKGAHWQGGGVTKKCEECGKEFSVGKTRIETARFCSPSCKGIWLAKHDKLPKLPRMFGSDHPNWKGGEILKKCQECGKEFNVKKGREKTGKFCSPKCKGIWMSKNLVGENAFRWGGGEVTAHCEECGKEFKIKKSHAAGRRVQRNFCSTTCHGIWNSKHLIGENNPNWAGGSKVYCEKWTLEFRRRIRAFFDHKCVECGTPQKVSLLHCHHVYYDKKACCCVNENGKYFSNLGIKGNPFTFEIIGEPNKFIALCDNCHKSTSGKKNREYWARHFEEIINKYYLGKSYFTREEYDKVR